MLKDEDKAPRDYAKLKKSAHGKHKSMIDHIIDINSSDERKHYNSLRIIKKMVCEKK